MDSEFHSQNLKGLGCFFQPPGFPTILTEITQWLVSFGPILMKFGMLRMKRKANPRMRLLKVKIPWQTPILYDFYVPINQQRFDFSQMTRPISDFLR